MSKLTKLSLLDRQRLTLTCHRMSEHIGVSP